ncbi:MAG: rhodanese-like domain-containing protein [Acidobacteriota bacterium]
MSAKKRSVAALVCTAWLGAGASIATSSALAWIVGVEEISPSELDRLLSSSNPPVVVDVTTREEFLREHLRGSVNAPLGELDSQRGAFEAYQNTTVVTVCQGGVRSALAASKLEGQGLKHVLSLSGGKLAWSSQGLPLESGGPPPFAASARRGPSITLSLVEQTVSVISAFAVKPAYMLLSLIAVLLMHRRRSRDMLLIRAGLAVFFAGELFCAINYLCTGGANFWLDMLHGIGMVAMGVLVPWGAFILVDERVIGLTQPDAGCSLRRFCARCWKQVEAPCAAHRIFKLVAPAMAVVSLMPWTAPIRELSEVGTVFGTPVAYSYSLPLQLADFRFYPAAGALCLAVASAMLCGGRRSMRSAQPFFFAGFGFMAFSLFRFLLLSAYRETPVWSDFWEELTELLFTVISIALLWIYREQLGLGRAARVTPSAEE